jgi:hypothetical protein
MAENKSTRKRGCRGDTQAAAGRPKTPDFIEALFQRTMREERITIEEFLAVATWAYRTTPEDLRHRACLRLIFTPHDLSIEHERMSVPQPGTLVH